MPSVKIVLDKRRVRKDKTYPLVIRIRHNRTYHDLATGYTLKSSQFNREKQSIIGDQPLTNELHKQRDANSLKLFQFLSDNDGASMSEVKALFSGRPKGEILFSEFWKEEAQKLIDSGRAGNGRVYMFSLARLEQVIDLSRPIGALTHTDIVEAEVQLLKSGMKVNSVGVYMRTFRTICNKAIHLGHAEQPWYPFAKFKIKKEQTVPRMISLEDMRKYFALNLEPDHVHYRSYCIGKLLFMLRGINLKDLLLLNKQNIRSNRVVYQRAKTKKLYSVELIQEARQLLEIFGEGKVTLLGILDPEVKSLNRSSRAVDIYMQKRAVINAHLKKIGELLEFDLGLSTYVFRYSWANIARKLGYPKDMIAEGLGHEYGNAVTGIYLECFDLSELDDMNKEICSAVGRED